MRASSRPAAVARLLTILFSSGAAAPVAAQDYYADIRPLLNRNCLACHSAAGPGWSMQDPEATYALRHAIAAAILERRMPPWLAEPGHQEYVNSRALPADVLDLVRRWRDGGFAKGAPRPDLRHAADAGAAHAAFEADVTVDVLPGDAYLPNQTRADDYRCFVADWPGDRTAYVTGFRAVVGNRRVGHHLVVHAIVPGMVDRFRELDAAEEGPGYQCFGGALPDRLGGREAREAYEARYPDGLREMNRAKFWLAHWAPGMDGHNFPEGTGIRLDPGSALVIQMHYYAGAAPGEPDAGTRMEFRIAGEVERPSFHLPQTLDPWLDSRENASMVIPSGQVATYEYADNLGDLLPYIARVTRVPEERIQGLEIHSANLHMHAVGHSGVISLRDRHGRKETLLSVPRWDLRWQQDFTFAVPKVFGRDELDGTLLSVECTFLNPGQKPVYGGFGSDDEMCFDFAYIAVRTGEPASPVGAGNR